MLTMVTPKSQRDSGNDKKGQSSNKLICYDVIPQLHFGIDKPSNSDITIFTTKLIPPQPIIKPHEDNSPHLDNVIG